SKRDWSSDVCSSDLQGDNLEKWAWCRWLPHVWSEGHRVRYVAANLAEASDVLYELASVLRNRSEMAAQAGSKAIRFRPWYIVVRSEERRVGKGWSTR